MANNNSLSGVLVGVVIGLVLIMASAVGLFWNEGRAVQTAQSLEEGAASVVNVESDTVDPDNEGELVHFSGQVDSDAVLSDPDFPIERDAIKLRRTVEMYQWHEREEERNDETHYTYHTDWSGSVVDSSRFNQSAQHQNPNSMPYNDHNQSADDVTVDAFGLSSTFIDQITNYSTIHLEESMLEELPGSPPAEPHITGNQLYFGPNPSNPSVGDVRITFSAVDPHEVSVFGQQEGSTLGSYATEAGDRLARLSAGRHTADEMFEQAMAENVAMTWMIRGGGLFAMFMGFVLFFGPVSFIARFIPLVGRLIIGAKKLISAGLTLVFGGGIIALAWVFYRPLIGIPLLLFFGAIAAGIFFLAYKNLSDQSDEELEPAAGGGDIDNV